MRLITCTRCQSQFDVASMSPGTSFVCGKCRNVLQVPEAGPVLQPIAPGSRGSGAAAPPPTVSLTPEQVRKALAASKEIQSQRAAPKPPAGGDRKLPKAMQQRAQASAQQSSQRAGGPAAGAAKPAAAAGGKKAATRKPAAKPAARSSAKASTGSSKAGSRTARSSSGGGGTKKKSQTGLFVGIAIGVVVLGALAFFGLKGGDDGDGGTAANGNGSGDAGTETAGNEGDSATGGDAAAGTGVSAETPLDEIGKFLALDAQKQMDDVGKRIAAAQSDLNGLKAIHDHFAGERFAGASSARKAIELAAAAALRLDATSEWANEASGKRNLRDYLKACIDECPKAFEFAEDDEIAVTDRHQELSDATPWVDTKDFREFETKVKAIRERETALAGDDRLIQVEKQKDWVRNNELFKELNIIPRFDEPYVIFQQWADMEKGMERYESQRKAKAIHFAKRDGAVFRELNNQFRNLFGERFSLPELKDKGRLLRVLILWDRATFDEWHRRQETGMPAGVRAYYSPTERHIVHYVGQDALTDQDEMPCAGDRVQKKSDQVTFHEGTHQLMHEYASIYQGNPLPADPAAEAAVPARKSMWFDEGLAEFMGAVEVDKKHVENLDGPFFHNRILLDRVHLAHSLRSQGAKNWPLGKMILPNHNGDMMRMGAEIMPTNPNLAANLFYAQAWAFVHFSWYYDNGKYRGKLLDYMERVLKNEHGPEAMVKAFGLPNADDWGDVGDEFDHYWNLLLRRKVGRKRGNTGWWIPETEAPTELYDPDGGGGDDYDE